MIARLSEATGAALVGNNFQPIPMEIPFPTKKKSVVMAQHLQSIKTFLTLELGPLSSRVRNLRQTPVSVPDPPPTFSVAGQRDVI